MYEEKRLPWLSQQLSRKKQPEKSIGAETVKKVNKQSNHDLHEEEEKQTKEIGVGLDQWDQISLKTILSGKHKKLYDGKSKYQEIKLVQATDVRMYLNEQLQFSSLDECIYHEAFVHIPMALTKSHKRVLILGGGDGCALREVIKYGDVKHIDLVDLDEEVLYAAKHVPEIAALNNRAFFDKRVHAYAQNALDFINKDHTPYDVIIIDFPDPTDPTLAGLYTLEMFQKVYDLLEEEGMIVCQSNSPDETPIVFWSIGRTMDAADFHTKSYHTIVPSFGDWGFHLGAKKSFSTDIRNINVPYRTLPKNPSLLFQFTPNCLRNKRYAVINRKEHLLLHEIFMKEVID